MMAAISVKIRPAWNAIIRCAINLAAALSLGTGQVAEPEHGGERRLAIAATNTKHGGSH